MNLLAKKNGDLTQIMLKIEINGKLKHTSSIPNKLASGIFYDFIYLRT